MNQGNTQEQQVAAQHGGEPAKLQHGASGGTTIRRAPVRRTSSKPYVAAVLLNGIRLRWADLSSWFISCVVLVVVVAVQLRPALWDPSKLPGGFGMSDVMISHWPSLWVIKETLAHDRRPPLWNPVYGGGRPIAADPLAALWYPPTHIVHLLDIRDSVLVLQVGHLLLAGLGMMVLARVALRVSFPAALTAGIVFMATPRLIAHLGAGHLTMVQTVAWLPWVATTCCATVRNPARWSVLFATCLALMLVAGHPQLAYYGSLMAYTIALWFLAMRWRQSGSRAVLASIAGIVLAGLLAGLLAAAHLLPLWEFAIHSTRQRSVHSTDALGLLPFVQALLGFRQASPVPHEALFEPGLAALGLAVLGVTMRPRQGIPIALGVCLVAGLALGISSPLYRVAATILPSFDVFRGLGRIWFLGLLGIALLAGLGVDMVVQWGRETKQRRVLIAGIFCLFLLVLSLDQATSGLTHVEDVHPHLKPTRLDLQAVTVAGNGRVYGVQRNMRQAVAAELDVQLADGWDPLLIEPYVTFMQRAGGYSFTGYQLSVPPFEVYDPGYPTSHAAQPNAALLGLVNVEAVLSRTSLTDPNLVKVTQLNDTLIYRNRANVGPAYLVATRPSGATPEIDTMQRLPAMMVVHEQQPERLDVSITSPTGGLLVIGSPAFPGWVAQLDGSPAEVITIEGVLPAVRVGPGTHQMSYMYAPASVYRGVLISLSGLLIGLGWLIGYGIAVKRRDRSAQEIGVVPLNSIVH